MKSWMLVSMLLILAACSFSVRPEQEKNTTAAQKLFEDFNAHHWKAMAEQYADDALFLDPSFGKEFVPKTRAETIAKYSDLEKMFPDIHDEVTNMYSSGNTVTVTFTSTGTMADGTTFSLPIASMLTFKDGLIVRDATYYDL